VISFKDIGFVFIFLGFAKNNRTEELIKRKEPCGFTERGRV